MFNMLKIFMALSILSDTVKFYFKRGLPRIPDTQYLKTQFVTGLTKSKVYSDLFSFIVNNRNTTPHLPFHSNIPVSYENVTSFINQIKYSTKSGCEKSPGRHKYHKNTEEAMNEQICAEFNAAFAYLSMACYFGRTEVALPGCQGFFMDMYEEELEHATIFINFQLMRGAHVLLSPINVPKSQDWKCIIKAFTVAVEMEKFIKEKLSGVFEIAEKHKDLQVMDLVSTQFMEEQNRSICELARLLARAKMTDNPTGEHLFDKFLYNSFVKKSKDNLMYKTKLDLSEDAVYK